MQEASLKREMSDAEAVLRVDHQSGWEEGLREWMEDVREGIKDIAAAPRTEEGQRPKCVGRVMKALVQAGPEFIPILPI